MQGCDDSQQELFCTVDLETFIPKDHLLRKIDKVVDLDFLYELTAHCYCSDNGRPSIDPVLFFRIQLINYLYGKNSFVSKYEIQQVGGSEHTEWWIPAEDIQKLNRNIVVIIEVICKFE